MRKQSILTPVLLPAILMLHLSCGGTSAMSEYAPVPCPFTNASIITVGKVLTLPTRSGTPHNSRYDGRPLQLFSFRANLENILNGDISVGPATISFFMYVDNLGGNARLGDMVVGERDVFFLLKDSGKLRIVCDGARACVPRVLTGAHPDFNRKIGYTSEEAILELMMSRGEHTTDKQMLQALDPDLGFTGQSTPHNDAYLNRLAVLAQTETPVISGAACNLLKMYEKPCRSKLQ